MFVEGVLTAAREHLVTIADDRPLIEAVKLMRCECHSMYARILGFCSAVQRTTSFSRRSERKQSGRRETWIWMTGANF